MNWHRKLGVSGVALVLFLILLELAGRAAFFQRHGRHWLALQDGVDFLRRRYTWARMVREAEATRELRQAYQEAGVLLYQPQGRELLEQFTREYEAHFAALVSTAQRIGTRPVLLYIPSRTAEEPAAAELFCRPFFRDLADRYKVDYLDMTDRLCQHPLRDVALLPQNYHLSRFGYQIVTRELNRYLAAVTNRCSATYDGAPEVCGDLEPMTRGIWDQSKIRPYLVTVNKQGFRMTEDVEIPKRRTRVLCLGDSATFGCCLPNPDTYPALLAQINPGLEVINAGACGYTIMDEASLFAERAQYVAPDITILQVLDNDVTEFFSFWRDCYDRKGGQHQPSPLESRLIEDILNRNKRLK